MVYYPLAQVVDAYLRTRKERPEWDVAAELTQDRIDEVVNQLLEENGIDSPQVKFNIIRRAGGSLDMAKRTLRAQFTHITYNTN